MSLFSIATLEILNLSNNSISVLPTHIALPRLASFEARNNAISKLPYQFVRCRELQILRLEGNPLDQSVLTLATRLPKLFDFSHGESQTEG